MAEQILVSAAISLTDALTEIGARFAASAPGGCRVRFNFAASGALAQQILAGAPADVFAAAAPKEMDDLARAGRIARATRADFASNRLVVVTPVGRSLRDWSDLTRLRRVAVANADSVPAGRYAKAALAARGVWPELARGRRLVYAENVRQALAYVATGNADAGLVFATDARAEPRRVRVALTAVPGRDHAPILYPAAVVARSRRPEAARRFAAYLRGREAQALLAKHGFAPVPGRSPR